MTSESILQLHGEGMSAAAIGRFFGRSTESICQVLRKHGIRGKRHPERQRVLELHALGLTPAEISEQLGVRQSTVLWHRRQAGIHGYCRQYLRALSPRQEAIILGTVMGDGNLSTGYGDRHTGAWNAALTLVHSWKQEDYLRWKVEELKPLFRAAPSSYETTAVRGGKKYLCVRAMSRRHPLLTDIYKLLYPGGRKSFGLPLFARLDQLNADQVPLMLAVWYMDDGTLDWKSSELALGAISSEEFGRVACWLTSRGFSGTGHGNVKSACLFYRMNQASTRDFLRAVAPHVHPSMRYKLGDQNV